MAENWQFTKVNFHLYHYAGNNPVRYIDPDGEVAHIALGAGIGALVGGISTIASGGSLRDIAAATVGGAVVGAMTAATGGLSLGASIAGSAMAGTAGYLAESMVAGNQATIEGVVVSGLTGATSVMTGAVVDKAINTAVSKISQAAHSAKGIKYQTQDKFQKTLEIIKNTGNAPEGYVGGRNFKNREGLLPNIDKNGNSITYREWDVNPKIPGQNRGAERLITGSDGSAWKTTDHYQSFTKME